jgi:hypothetical protein
MTQHLERVPSVNNWQMFGGGTQPTENFYQQNANLCRSPAGWARFLVYINQVKYCCKITYTHFDLSCLYVIKPSSDIDINA